MKILLVNTSDIQGGAARAAYRLHKSLLAQNIESQMLVQNKSSDDFTVKTIANTKLQKFTDKLRPYLNNIPLKFYKKRNKILFSTSIFGSKTVIDKINECNPDIVHLHWICGGMLKIEDLSKIKVPIIWSMHDDFAFTGGCHIKWQCEGYKNNCGNCEVLKSNKEKDLSRWVWHRKNKTFLKMNNLIINGLSKWIMNCSKESSLLKNKKHVNLPNPLDTNIYKSFNKKNSRELWNLPKDKKLVLFGAMDAVSDINKGFRELSEAIKKLDKNNNIELVVFGSNKPRNEPDFRFKVHYLGHLHDDVSLVILYSAVDVMIVPSLQEAFGQTAIESMACETPVVAFATSGLLDIVDHQKNGYLAKPFDTIDLKDGIEWIINLDVEKYNKLCKNAREKVLKEFDSVVVANKYIKLYQDILDAK